MTRRTVLVAGAAGGMGRAIVGDLARDSDAIAVCRTASQLGGDGFASPVRVLAADLTDVEAYQGLLAGLDRLDVLVHAAAIAERWSVADADADVWRRHLEINVLSPALLTRAALPLLRAAHGQVVFLNSGAGTTAHPHHAVYSASKFALTALADALRGEEEPHRVRVATVAPGPTLTPMAERDAARTGRPLRATELIDPASVAAAVRLVVDASADAQITQVAVRPRVELR